MKWFFAVFFSFFAIFLSIFGINCIYGTIFPIKYTQEVSTASKEFNVEQAIIMSVINTESHFNKNAISKKGAVGLMQIMPTTAQNLTTEKDINLKDPSTNITLGTKYLAQLLSRFEILETAIAAYNAGPTNVSAWLTNEKYSDDKKTLKDIPFPETKNYVEKFNKNYQYYRLKI